MSANPQIASDLHILTAPFRFVFSLVRAAMFVAIFPLVILGLCVHVAMIGGPIMDDDMWFLTKVLFCVLAPFAFALIAGVFSKGSLTIAWAKKFLVLILSFVAVACLLRFHVVTFDEGDHAPVIWTNLEYDYSNVYKGGTAFRIGDRENGKFELSYEEIQSLRSRCLSILDESRSASCVKSVDCMRHSATPDDWKAQHCGQMLRKEEK
jgi:hypothetical protein